MTVCNSKSCCAEKNVQPCCAPVLAMPKTAPSVHADRRACLFKPQKTGTSYPVEDLAARKKQGRLRRIKRASRPRRRSRCVGQTFPNDSKCTTVFQIWTCRTHSDVHRFCMRMTRIPFMNPMQIHLRRSSAPWNY